MNDEEGRSASRLVRSLVRSREALLGALIVVMFVVTAIGAPVVAPLDPLSQSLQDRLLPPVWQDGGSAAHLLGTDQLGRDVLS
ncbi:MAG: ABC transporter permease, partial [Gemmatimonadales bacterium]|nr:ABC transporter permease [Gemmatimonadales bacterium]